MARNVIIPLSCARCAPAPAQPAVRRPSAQFLCLQARRVLYSGVRARCAVYSPVTTTRHNNNNISWDPRPGAGQSWTQPALTKPNNSRNWNHFLIDAHLLLYVHCTSQMLISNGAVIVHIYIHIKVRFKIRTPPHVLPLSPSMASLLGCNYKYSEFGLV